ncbi:MAG: hypothetical protein E7653_05770 [Ruminococcaceae bacterium]|nr:hypothetical protein [Oscillospiraceae bacterium]
MPIKEQDSKASVLHGNISELLERERRNAEQQEICIDMLAKELFSQKGTDALKDIYSELCGALCAERKARACERLCSLAGQTEICLEQGVFGESEDIEKEAVGRIAYVKNRRNDDVFLSFARNVKGAKAEYVASFQDACEAVADGRCEFCIMPIENDADGKLYSFYRLLDRYDLKIQSIAKVMSDDNSQGIVFALVAGRIKVLPHERGKLRFEFSVVGEGADILTDILAAVKSLDGAVYSTATLPVEYDARSCRCYFAIDLSLDKTVPMALYLSLEYHGYTPLGLYSI